jgi:hypothetical protein
MQALCSGGGGEKGDERTREFTAAARFYRSERAMLWGDRADAQRRLIVGLKP